MQRAFRQRQVRKRSNRAKLNALRLRRRHQLRVTDIAYMTTLINTPGLNIRFFNPPRQFGIALTAAL